MTVCETETVHEDYGKLFDLFDRIAVASEFCKKVFSRQFPRYRILCLTSTHTTARRVHFLPHRKYNGST